MKVLWMKTMSYEDYLNEVTTLIYELYDLDEEAAIGLVVAAQDAEYFVLHDLAPEMRTLANARLDALKLFQQSIQWWDDTGRNARFVRLTYGAVKAMVFVMVFWQGCSPFGRLRVKSAMTSRID
jgi:hypothetical protein